MRPTACLTLVAAVLLAGGCGSSSSSSSTSTPAPAAPAAPTPASGPAVTVIMRNVAFIPTTVTVHVGQTVKWINKDNVAHNVTASNGQTFQSPTFGNGGSFTFTPKVAGSIAYTCTIHPNMLATLIVKP